MVKQQQQYVAIGLPDKMPISLVHENSNEFLTNNDKNSPIDTMTQNSSTIKQKQEQSAAIKNFQEIFCGFNSTTSSSNSNGYTIEGSLPQNCEMPLGIGVDNNAHKVWYISTKKGILGSFDIIQNKFDQEYIIPNWNSRETAFDYSQVWSLQVDDGSKQRAGEGDVWFTDAKQNAIWKFSKSLQSFEIYKIPGNSTSFGTIYPISLEIDSKNNRIFFVGTFSLSLWIGDITKMKNGTSDGISQIHIPINGFNGIDPALVTTGSIALDSKNNVVWISMLSYGRKGVIFQYNINTNSFKIFDLPAELNSPLGMVVDDGNSRDLWITNAGTSIFYKLNPQNGNIMKFVTSKASPRLFGGGIYDDNGGQDNSNNNSDQSNFSKTAYTLPYWIKKAHDGSLWFNEQEGNKIARFDPSHMKLIEYWIPTQNKLWSNCRDGNNNNYSNSTQICGIANVLQFSIMHNNDQVWFTEWSENKIGKIDAKKPLPFSMATFPQKELKIKRGESREIKIKITATAIPLSSSFSSISNIHMLASGTFTSTGDLGNSTGYFSRELFSLNAAEKSKQVSFTFTPSMDLKPGKYVLMIGAENDSISNLKAIKVNVI
jgi:virginiamycin B lyase